MSRPSRALQTGQALAPEKKICGAKSKRTGEPCRGTPMLNGRCRMHGGSSPRGPAQPSFRHGRYSKDLPTRLMAQYQQSLTDPDLLVMREDIALLDSRLTDVLKRVDSGESGNLWSQLKRTWALFSDARAATNVNEMTLRLAQVEQFIEKGSHDSHAWREVSELLDQRRKLVESERKRLVDLQQMITTERALLLVGSIEDIIRRNVEDPHVLASIARDIRSLITHGAGGAASSGG